MIPQPIKKFVEIIAKLPAIGPRQAIRTAFYLIRAGKDEIKELADAIYGLQKLKPCSQCFFVHENQDSLCPICSDKSRNKDVIAVVEKETDLLSLEQTGKFNGRYFIIGNLRKNGELDAEQKLRLKALKALKPKEIILAINPTAYGDAAAFFLQQELKNDAEKITRLGRGIPTGGEIEFADEETLGSALENRN